jgi:hypothetical protein
LNLLTSLYQQEIQSEEEWEEEAVGSIRELAEQFGVSSSWLGRRAREYFALQCAEQCYHGEGQYHLDEQGGVRFIPGSRKVWLTVGQAGFLEVLASELKHRQARRNGRVVVVRPAYSN